jgi:hypothetical protein
MSRDMRRHADILEPAQCARAPVQTRHLCEERDHYAEVALFRYLGVSR